MRVLVTGSRTWTDETAVFDALDDCVLASADLTVVHGDCPTGADRIARRWCERMKVWGVVEERHPAAWQRHGRRAGYVRNAEMAALGADLCIAFSVNASPGTAMMVELAEKAGIPVQLVLGGPLGWH